MFHRWAQFVTIWQKTNKAHGSHKYDIVINLFNINIFRAILETFKIVYVRLILKEKIKQQNLIMDKKLK